MSESELRVVVERPTRGDQVAGDLVRKIFAQAAKPGPSRTVQILGLDVVGERRLGWPRRSIVSRWTRRPVVALRARINIALRARINIALRALICAACRSLVTAALWARRARAASITAAWSGLTARGWWHDNSLNRTPT